MRVRDKILVYFSSTTIALSAITFFIIYLLFAAFREEEFQQRQEEKIITTLRLLAGIEKTDYELADALDTLSINSILDEKLLIFDRHKNLVYSSLDNMPISYTNELLNRLNSKNTRLEVKDGQYDVVAIYFEHRGRNFYGISKAYDSFGYTKLAFLRNTLFVSFAIITTLVVLISLFLAKIISRPITVLSDSLSTYRLGSAMLPEWSETGTKEIKNLGEKFTELVRRSNEAYAFQKHSIHHISHQLKTPLAVLVSELERIKQSAGSEKIRQDLEKEIDKTKYLADIINVLLEISKIEAGQLAQARPVRIDEVIFDIIQELNVIHPEFNFEVNYFPGEVEADRLIVKSNDMLIREALRNLLGNCIAYSDNHKAEVRIDCSSDRNLKVTIINSGPTVEKGEEKYLFDHFFRGANSRGKIGFGLGLVLSKKIIDLHSGSVTYASPTKNLNQFEVRLPLS